MATSVEGLNLPFSNGFCSSPIMELKYFHTAIRAELSRLHDHALALEKGTENDMWSMLQRYHFLRKMYQYHSSGEDEVILPALDRRVKNVASTYCIEHKAEEDLFEQTFELLHAALNEKGSAKADLLRRLICCIAALQTTLGQHLSKEEEQVLPLLMIHFSRDEQALLVWQFLCCIPLNLMEECLPWMASFLSEEERQEMLCHLRVIVPGEKLLQQVISTWLSRGDRSLPVIISGWTQLIARSKNNIDGRSKAGDILETAFENSTQPISGDTEPKVLFHEQEVPAFTVKATSGTSAAVSIFPINELILWHNAIRKELDGFAEEARRIHSSGVLTAVDLSSFAQRYRFLADVCFFHSTAEDEVVFPALDKKLKHPWSYLKEHAEEEQQFLDVGRLLDCAQLSAKKGLHLSLQLFRDLSSSAETIANTVRQHLLDEELKVIPLVREYCSVEEQRVLVYRCLREMPLRLIERVLPWVVAFVSEDDAADMIHNMRLAAPEVDSPLVALFSDWAQKSPGKKPTTSEQGWPWMNITGEAHKNAALTLGGPMRINLIDGGLKREVHESIEDLSRSLAEMHNRPAKRLKESSSSNVQAPVPEYIQLSSSSSASTFTEKLGFKSPPFSHMIAQGIQEKEEEVVRRKPIDTIFQFHHALRADLEFLDVESAKLADADDDAIDQFSGRFQFLRGLYHAHSNAEDEIVFPALESKEALHNVSHSYTIDHIQEEQFFKEIAEVLSELRNTTKIASTAELSTGVGDEKSEGSEVLMEKAVKRKELGQRLHRMCSSVRVSLDQHVSREEVELWPLFEKHFTVEEQDKIVGRIIGTTGAEVLQAMLPWITRALTEDEQFRMVDNWRQATKNTMFDQWLSAWWTESEVFPTSRQSDQEAIKTDVDPDPQESLKMVVDYFQGESVTIEGPSNEFPVDAADSCPVLLSAVWEEETVELAKHNTNHHVEEGQENSKLDQCRQGVVENSMQKSSEGQVIQHLRDSTVDIGNGSSPSLKSDGHDSMQEQRVISKEQQRFKPGWPDIFRMNQQELEQAIRKVSSDSKLDPRRKSYLIQNLMTSRWIAAQQKQPKEAEFSNEGKLGVPGRCQSYQDEAKKIFGCEHYKRNCKLKAVCCGELVTCRFCHDKISDHSMNRQATKEMMCMQCLEVQPVAQRCITPSCCDFSMARYYCGICKLFDNDDRDIYHCPFCNLCRVGKGLGIDYFHCMTCNACMSMAISSHKCREKGLESNCPICHDFLFTSNTPVKALPCGHFMHSACFQAYTCNHYTCPICSKSVGDMAVYFGMLDALLASEQLPEEYRDRQQNILCNDCEKKGTVSFHWLYHKCSHCGSYNTRTI